MLPNYYEVEEVARMRREEAEATALSDQFACLTHEKERVRPIPAKRLSLWVRMRQRLLIRPRRKRMAMP